MNPESTWAAQAAANRQAVRAQKPLVHNITNYVVMNFTANVLLAAGAAPVMAHAENEVEEMVAFAKALVLNIGTLDDAWIASMLKAGRKASELGVLVILDPVGAGATTLRTEAARRILGEVRVSLVRGNASEILALSGAAARTRGWIRRTRWRRRRPGPARWRGTSACPWRSPGRWITSPTAGACCGWPTGIR